MTREAANQLLERVKCGDNSISESTITLALTITGDLAPKVFGGV